MNIIDSYNYFKARNQTWKFFLIIFLTLIICGLTFFITEKLPEIIYNSKPTLRVADNLWTLRKGDKALIQGYVDLESEMYTSNKSTTCGAYYWRIPFYSTENIGDNISIFVYMRDTKTEEPNRFFLPDNFIYEDLIIFTEDGKKLGYFDEIKVIGEVESIESAKGKTRINICVKEVSGVY